MYFLQLFVSFFFFFWYEINSRILTCPEQGVFAKVLSEWVTRVKVHIIRVYYYIKTNVLSYTNSWNSNPFRFFIRIYRNICTRWRSILYYGIPIQISRLDLEHINHIQYNCLIYKINFNCFLYTYLHSWQFKNDLFKIKQSFTAFDSYKTCAY